VKRRTLTPTQRAAVFRDAGGICHLCSRRIAPGEAWEIEHVQALALRGADDPTNWRPAHADCHAVKSKDDVRMIRKADRQAKAHAGIKRSSRPLLGSKASGWRKKMDGSVERR
jgi:5-methylcytosine-specific restriction enzyme A